MTTFPLVDRVNRLEARVASIERLFDLPPLDATAPAKIKPPATPVQPAESVAPPIVSQPEEQTPETPAPATTPSDAKQITPPVVADHKRSTTTRLFTATDTPATKQSKSGGFDFGKFEELFAGKWMAWVGALFVVIGAGFLAKLAYDNGLWGMIPAAVRCLLLGIFGGALVGGGEYTLRKWGRPAAVGLFSAGLGVWFITAYATAAWYQLLPEFGAWVLMAIVAAAGFALTSRTRSLTIGVLTLIAAYATPLLMHGAANDPIVLPLYLTAVFSVPLALSAFRPRPFRPLRFVALGGQALLGAVWLVWRVDAWQTVVFFGGIWWAMVAAESIYAAHRKQSRAGNALATLIATALFVTGACIAIHTALAAAAPYWSGGLTLCVAALAVIAAVQFGDGIEPLRTKPGTALSVLTLAMWLQAGVLTVVAAALLLDHLALTIAWLAVAIATIEVGRRLSSSLTDAFGLIVLALAAGKAITVDAVLASPLAGGATVLWEINDVLRLTDWSLVLVGVAATLTAASFRIREGAHKVRRALPIVLFCFATLFWLLAAAVTLRDLWMTGAWLITAAFLLAHPDLGKRQGFAIGGSALGPLSLAKWMFIDVAATQIQDLHTDTAPLVFLNAPFIFGVVLAGAIASLWYRTRWRANERGIKSLNIADLQGILPALAVMILAWAVGFEIERLVDRYARTHHDSAWGFANLLQFWLIMLAGLAGTTLAFASRAVKAQFSERIGLVALMISTIVWLTFGTLMPRIFEGTADATPFLNPQFASGVLLLFMLAVVVRGLWNSASPFAARSDESADRVIDEFDEKARITLLALLGLLPLWLGSLEVDRFLPDAISIYWGLYGIGLVVLGWVRPVAIVRHAGLALLLVALGKVLVIDTAQLEGIARPISYLVIGLLFVLTSIGYARLSPKLAERTSRAAGEVKPDAAVSQPPVEGEGVDDGREADGDQSDADEDDR